jgi:hypothetical protein
VIFVQIFLLWWRVRLYWVLWWLDVVFGVVNVVNRVVESGQETTINFDGWVERLNTDLHR